MVFSSPVFLFLFLPLTLLFTWMAGSLKGRNTVLTLASLLFYAWGEGLYVLVILGSILFNYIMALAIEGASAPERRKLAVVVGVVGNLAGLLVFKYANFIVDSVNVVLGWSHLAPIVIDHVHLPIGISFFVFQGISYVVDVYRGDARAQRQPGHVALFKALFPQLIAGPIVRYPDVAHEIEDRHVDIEAFARGARRFITGLAKKILIADTVSRAATPILALHGADVPPATAWLGAFAYTIQIYFDFSGYSDMAIGIGHMLGFRIPENFDYPYIARSVREFWKRWHMSLTTWFRDYLFIPLGGSKGPEWKTYRNLIIVFLLTGLWHGASWNFIVWGAMNGFFLVIERVGLGKLLKRVPAPLAVIYAVGVFTIGWSFFCHETMDDAWHYLLAMLGVQHGDPGAYFPSIYLETDITVALLIGIVFATPYPQRWLARLPFKPSGVPAITGDLLLHGLLFVLCAMAMSSRTYDPFIYFRF